MFVSISSGTPFGVKAIPIGVELDVAGSWPGFQIVGLGDAAVQEAKERIRTAWKNSGLDFPNNSRIVINLAPADVPKAGTVFDLPMATALLLALKDNPKEKFSGLWMAGELALDGSLRRVPGILVLAKEAAARGARGIVVPKDNAREAALIKNLPVYPVEHLSQVIAWMESGKAPETYIETEVFSTPADVFEVDFAHVAGQEAAKRALEIAAAGNHNLLLSGPPGSGKTMLARALPGILPPLTSEELLESSMIYSVAGLLGNENLTLTHRPFRAPHHSASAISLVGGGKNPRPGEISLAHRGILFLDEFPEFPRLVIESLRQPLEDGLVTVSRAQGSAQFPARFLLVASQNPCPCGYFGDETRSCVCPSTAILRYEKKISGPILDRIDLHVEVPRLKTEKLMGASSEPSLKVRERVVMARNRGLARAGKPNSELAAKEIKEYCRLDKEAEKFFVVAAEKLQLSGRAFHRLLKVARTIADLDEQDDITVSHLSEALQFRKRTTV